MAGRVSALRGSVVAGRVSALRGSLVAGRVTAPVEWCPERAKRVEGHHIPHVYILRCSDATLYVGHTSDLAARVDWHNRGFGPRYTAIRRPVQLAHSEEFRTLHEAVARERQLKAWSGQKKEALIAGDSARLKALSKRRGSGKRRHSPQSF